MQRVETLRSVVYPCHCDVMGHLTTSQYMLMFDAASWSLLSHAGVDDDLGRAGTLGWADVEVTMKFLREVRAGSPVAILSGFSHIGNRSVAINHEMRPASGGDAYARYVSSTVRFDLQARMAVPLPAGLDRFLLDTE